MPTNEIENRVGTQRQFTKQPGSTYQRNLRGVQDSTQFTAQGIGYRGRFLANALADFGNQILNYGVASEERKRTIAQRAVAIANGATKEDWETRSTMGLLADAGLGGQLTNNPYAVALIEEGRGKFSNSQMNLAYQDIIDKEGRRQTVGEEVQRYQKFATDWYKEHVGESYNDVGFQRGYYAKFPEDVNNQALSTSVEVSERLAAIRDGTIQSDIGEVMTKAKDMDATQFATAIQDIMNRAEVSSAKYTKRQSYMQGAIESAVQMGIDPEKLDALKNVVIATLPEGQAIKAGDVFDWNQYSTANNVNIKQHMNLDYSDRAIEMNRCKTIEELDDWWDALSPEWQDIMHDTYEARRITLDKEIRTKQEQARQAATKSHFTDMGVNMATQELMKVFNGQVTASSWSDVKYQTVDAYDNPVIQGVKKEEGMVAFRQVCQMIDSDPTMTDEEKTEGIMRLMASSLGSSVSGDYKGMMEDALATIAPDESPDSPAYRTIDRMTKMYRSNPANARRALGSTLAAEASTLNLLSDFFGGPDKAIYRYASCRDRLADSDFKAACEKTVKDSISGDAVELSVLDGGTMSLAYTDDPTIRQIVDKAGLYLIASNVPVEKARETIVNELRDKYCVLPDGDYTVVPKALFGKIVVDEPYAVGQQYLTAHIADLMHGETSDANRFDWDWDESTSQLVLWDYQQGRIIESYYPDDFARTVTEWAAMMAPENGYGNEENKQGEIYQGRVSSARESAMAALENAGVDPYVASYQ